ncbi:uncharacterized protein LOC126377469 [Pectinophora gossypiella]|uniref:uncharacterized protein LOC126377469 n=1 Tax=Pectinophora gossypiella TaxID=13191 RepID=UPI00214E98D0|nr:uncharacterized protein LOC126377469 [Pectinophora gossypiella]
MISGSARDSNFCDKSDNIKMPEGNVGQTANFPWLGILRVQLREPYSKNYRVAVTGVVLIKLNYALAVSKDIAKIPKHILLDDSNVLFISTVNTTTYVKVKDCLHHPEHEVLTLNTITIIELEITKNLHKVFEKEIHKMLYFDKQMCDEFYIRSNLNEELKTPTRYECAFAVHNEGACVVENGMAIVSNASGYWMLIGLSLHGPGCAAPNRFIELSTFLPWLTRSTDDADVISDEKYRRSFDAA